MSSRFAVKSRFPDQCIMAKPMDPSTDCQPCGKVSASSLPDRPTAIMLKIPHPFTLVPTECLDKLVREDHSPASATGITIPVIIHPYVTWQYHHVACPARYAMVCRMQ